jgi:hypothetical protein
MDYFHGTVCRNVKIYFWHQNKFTTPLYFLLHKKLSRKSRENCLGFKEKADTSLFNSISSKFFHLYSQFLLSSDIFRRFSQREPFPDGLWARKFNRKNLRPSPGTVFFNPII